jgi:hypothetical protein
MGVFQNHLMGAAAGASAGAADFYDYQIANSYRSMAGVGYFTRTPSSAGNRKKYTISFWFKRTLLSSTVGEFDIFCNAQESSTTNYTDSIRFQGDGDKLQIAFKGTLSGNLITTRVFRDTSAWMHLVCAVDTTQTTAANRVKLYINGEQETDFDTETYPAQDYQGGWCNDREHALGRFTGASYTTIGNFYMANFALVDGSQLAPTSFGTSKNGVWIPDDLSELTWGTTGTWVRFESSSDLGNDSSGNNNDWTNNSVATHDQMLDSPTFDSSSNGGNFATLGGLEKNTGGFTISEGNLKYAVSTNNRGFIASQGVPESGKYYWEVRVTQFGGTQDQIFFGVCDPNKSRGNLTASRGGAETSGAGNYVLDNYNGRAILDGTAQSNDSIGNARSVPQTFGVAVDRDNNTFKWTYDGSTYSSTYAIPSSGVLAPFIGSGGGSNTASGVFNFGADSTFAGLVTAGGNSDGNGYGDFSLAVPSGYVALCAANLPVEDEVDPAQTDDDYPQKLFDAKLYTGDGTSSNAITGVGFQPDFVWIKSRSAAENHNLYDSTRGANKRIKSNTIGGETTEGLPSFDSDGFTVDATGSICNVSSRTYVAWNWRINGGTTATNSDGSVDSTVQVDPSGAFSLVKYRGGLTGTGAATVGHGLSKAPSMIIFKGYGNLAGGDGQWWVGSDELTSWNYFLRLNTTADEIDKSGNGSMSSPTSTVFSVNNTDGLGASTIDNLAYCFTNVEGYCKTGGYTGNANDDGAFVYTGFRPAWILMREIATDNWGIYDDKRIGQNNDSGSGNAVLYPDTNNDEENQASRAIDLLSNGFKLRTSNATFNASGNYVYLAFAENPFKYATAR